MEGRCVQLFFLFVGLFERSWQLNPAVPTVDVVFPVTAVSFEDSSAFGSSAQGIAELSDRLQFEAPQGSNSTRHSDSDLNLPNKTNRTSPAVEPSPELLGNHDGEDILTASKLNQSEITKGSKVLEEAKTIIPEVNFTSTHASSKNVIEVVEVTTEVLVPQSRGEAKQGNSSGLGVEKNSSSSDQSFGVTPDPLKMIPAGELAGTDVDEPKRTVVALSSNDSQSFGDDDKGNFSVRVASIKDNQNSYNSMSWLDALMLHHRGTFFVIINTFFMVVWVLVGILSLYRLLGLPWCSPYVSRTQYLVIHLLIFTASTFEFVQLIHLCYGSHKGLPLFLTLLLTHTPTPCLAVSLIIMTYCIFASTRVPVFGSYLPPMIYVSILAAFIIVFSFVGDIIVGVTRSSIFLIIIRVVLIGLCLVWLLSFIVNYRKIIGVALIMRREFRGELKALAIPVDSSEENQDARLHLKKMLLVWTRLTLLSCISGVLMCIFSFCFSLFFTVSFVPLWAFWVLHSVLFLSQITLVFSLTFGAAFTLMYNTRRSITFKYFLPSLLNESASNGSFIKRGNFIYQRVSVSNGPITTSISPPPTAHENEQQHGQLRNNNLVDSLTSPQYRSKVNLKRSATFNCATPYGFHHPSGPPFHPSLYPVLSDHILPYSYSQVHPDFVRPTVNDSFYEGDCRKPNLRASSSFNHPLPGREYYRHSAVPRRYYPYRGLNGTETNSGVPVRANQPINMGANINDPSHEPLTPPVTSNSYRLAGTLQTLDVTYPPSNVAPMKPEDRNVLRQIPRNHSFASADRQRYNKPEPPEKPARKAEPILVKGVLKDNVNLEMALPTMGSPTDAKEYPYSFHKNPNVYFSEKGYSRDRGRLTTLGTPPNAKKFAHVPNLGYNKMDVIKPLEPSSSYLNKEVTSPSVSPVTTCSVSLATSESPSSPDKSLLERNSPQGTESELDTSSSSKQCNIGQNRKRRESLGAEEPIGGAAPNAKKADLALDFPVSKKNSLKRNHSTAGEFSPREVLSGTESETTSVPAPQDSNGLDKYPWYGTWGGRRRSKKKGSTLGHSNTSGSTLSRLSASKSSLSNIYEKLKPRKSKSAKRKDCLERSFDTPESPDKGSSVEGDLEETEPEEEEDELLPRLDEDIDLASEIFRSSTVLADFYSLDRSFLKKRKNERLKNEENDQKQENEDDKSESKENGLGSSPDNDSYKSLNSNAEDQT